MFFLGPIGPTELVLIILLIVIIFGAKKLPELGKSMGEGIKNEMIAIVISFNTIQVNGVILCILKYCLFIIPPSIDMVKSAWKLNSMWSCHFNSPYNKDVQNS